MALQNLRVPVCPRRANGHAWQLARECSTRECEAQACRACGLVRMTSYRTGQVVRYEPADQTARAAADPHRHDDEMPAREHQAAVPGELPSVALTARFLALCQQYGSERLAVRIVAAGRSTGVPGLPEDDDSTTWDAGEMRAAVEHLQRKRGL